MPLFYPNPKLENVLEKWTKPEQQAGWNELYINELRATLISQLIKRLKLEHSKNKKEKNQKIKQYTTILHVLKEKIIQQQATNPTTKTSKGYGFYDSLVNNSLDYIFANLPPSYIEGNLRPYFKIYTYSESEYELGVLSHTMHQFTMTRIRLNLLDDLDPLSSQLSFFNKLYIKYIAKNRDWQNTLSYKPIYTFRIQLLEKLIQLQKIELLDLKNANNTSKTALKRAKMELSDHEARLAYLIRESHASSSLNLDRLFKQQMKWTDIKRMIENQELEQLKEYIAPYAEKTNHALDNIFILLIGRHVRSQNMLEANHISKVMCDIYQIKTQLSALYQIDILTKWLNHYKK